jgi:DNA polymerase elongation subunit (family B)
MIINIEELEKILKQGSKEDLEKFAQTYKLKIEDNKIKVLDSSDALETIAYWDKRQLVKKINLNSLYGALLNPGCRFNDKRIGQSTTLSGRTITKHMNACVNQCITGNYEHEGDAIIYLDTDSSYFSAWPMVKTDVGAGQLEWNKDICVGLYDNIADQVNESFPAMCFAAFHAPEQNGNLIRCGRELVASKGLYITKKRYAVMIYDLEGKRLDQLTAEEAKKKGIIHQVGKLKAMGLDLKRADTPKFVQDFLIEILTDLLTGEEKTIIIDKILNFKKLFRKLSAWEKGKPMRVNNLTRYRDLESRKGKANLPGHVRASLNWNSLRNLNSDRRSLPIVDGMKVIVCKLRGNPMNYTSIAYPVDELRLPEWFKTLPFDQDTMEQIVVDTKVENLLGELNWDLKSLTNPSVTTFNSLFSAR